MSTAIGRPQRPVSRADFPLAIICALSLEADAIEALFDEYWDCHAYSKAPGDPNSYSTGRIGHHNVVLAYMPEAGKANGAAVATNCRVSFPGVKLAIVVGVCGVIPFTPGPRDAHHEIILGDVIVSQSVVQYDLGRQYPATFEYKDTNEEALGRPNVEIRSLLSKLKSLRARRAFESDMRKFLSILQEDRELAAHYPEPGTDRLFEATYRHVDNDVPCDKCGCDGKLVPRQRLRQGVPEPRVHFGRIASGDTVMKSGEERDDIARKLGVIAFEMESAGVWDSLPCLVVKGACDYADSHKAKATQNYAAATAAACTKAILRHWVVSTPPELIEERNLPRFLVPFPPNDDFVGRQDIIGSLRQQLSPEKSHAVAAVFGLGGVGKTQIALAYVHELHAQSPDLSVLWVYASNEERMRQAYANIMQQLKIPCGGENSDVLERVKQWLEAQHHKPWLMVIDNVDELDLFYGTGGLSRYFPTCAHGKLLITTRNRQVAVRATKGRGFIEVSRMTDSEARELLGAHLGCLESDIADLSTLALKLEYLPLILVQAAAFIQENSISVREYLALLKNDKNMVELLNEDFETSGKDPDSLRAVARTWMISFRQIRHQNKLAGELLSLVSTFHHQHISGNLLVHYVSCIYDRESSLELVKAIGVLKAFSIVSATKDNGISMHRLIQLVMRRWLFQEGIVENFLQNAMMLMHSKLGAILNEDGYMQIEHIIVHIVSIASVSADAVDAKILRSTNTLDMLELTILRLLCHTVLRCKKGGYKEKEIRLIQEAERNASLCIQETMRKLSIDNHVRCENLTILMSNLKAAAAIWKWILPPGTSDVIGEVMKLMRNSHSGLSGVVVRRVKVQEFDSTMTESIALRNGKKGENTGDVIRFILY